jgi:hypothetical protein
MVESVFSNFYKLQEILKRYEDTVRFRWAKKTRAQRQKILVVSWHTDLPRSYRPDLLRFRKNQTEYDNDDDDFSRDIYKWPHISLEDLLPPTTLLRLLNAPGRNLPSAFAAMDWDCTELGREEWVLKTVTLMQPHIIDLDGDSPEDYGKLIPIDDREIPNATFSALILEIQDGLMKFLVMVCQGVLVIKSSTKKALKRYLKSQNRQACSCPRKGDGHPQSI